jgi:hypothetical protein
MTSARASRLACAACLRASLTHVGPPSGPHRPSHARVRRSLLPLLASCVPSPFLSSPPRLTRPRLLHPPPLLASRPRSGPSCSGLSKARAWRVCGACVARVWRVCGACPRREYRKDREKGLAVFERVQGRTNFPPSRPFAVVAVVVAAVVVAVSVAVAVVVAAVVVAVPVAVAPHGP